MTSQLLKKKTTKMDERMLYEKVMHKLISYVAEHTNKTTSEINRKLQIDSVQGFQKLIGKFETFYQEYEYFQDKVLMVFRIKIDIVKKLIDIID